MQYAQNARDCVAAYMASAGLAGDIAIYTAESDLMIRAKQPGKIDLLFSDINLGEARKNGIEVVKSFQLLQPDCPVVYLTNYLTFATEVYDTPHIYFVLKSELEQRLPDVLAKANLLHRHSRMVRLKKKGMEVVIDPETIIYCEHHGRMTDIVTADGTLAVYQKISDLMGMLDARDFVHCHMSYIVHLRYVARFQRIGFVMKNGQAIPISRNNIAEARRKFEEFSARMV
ncbi:MAG: LytR/AlgR family response regulator transcription factor [Butyricicoccus sp.]